MLKRPLKSYGYLLAYLIPLSLPLSVESTWGQAHPVLSAWMPMIVLFVILPIFDYALGRDTKNPSPESESELTDDWFFRAVTWLALPIYAALLAWSIHTFSQTDLSIGQSLGWVLSQGIVGGVIAINVAHELIHKDNAFERACGGTLLALVNYIGFKIEHLRGHHVNVSTPLDASSARFNQSVYPFLLSALWHNSHNAWLLEKNRLQKQGLGAWHWQNEFLRWQGLVIVFASLAWLLGGFVGLVFFFVQGLFAAISLEIINYVEHYGLERQVIAPNRYERVTHLHSWNSSYRLSNWLLFQLQRHSDHHATPKRRYQSLRHHNDSPQLPGGYASMFLLALVPPLWKRIINPRLLALNTNQPAASS